MAWISLALLPVGFVLAMVLGEWLITRRGYGTGSDVAVPVGDALLAAGPAILVFVTPAIAAVWFGLRARRHGRPSGATPAIIGTVSALGFIAQNIAAFIVGRVGGR